MLNENVIFLELYKDLNNHLKTVYGGVEDAFAAYIKDLESSPLRDTYYNYYKDLLRIRDLRNTLVLDRKTLYNELIELNDIDYLKKVYKDIVDRRDPLASYIYRSGPRVLNERVPNRPVKERKPKNVRNVDYYGEQDQFYPNQYQDFQEPRKKSNVGFILTLCFLVLIAVVIIIFLLFVY